MPSLRDEITKTFQRFNRRGSSQVGRAPKPARQFDLKPGTEVGQYQIEKRLGSGGMGDVFLARDKRLGRQVALKFLPREWTDDPKFLHRFQQEARTASALNHPNILTIFDFCDENGEQVIVSEFVEGMTLRKAMENEVLDLESGLEIVRQIASALVAAHAAGIVHRDLKPSNVMLRPDGYIKVIDFGLAKLTEHSARSGDWTLTRPGAVLGTVGYMSPEQARGEDVDHRTDIWSLGVILYEIIAKQPPFEGRTDNHLIVAILDHPPRALPNPEAIPPGLGSIVSKALEKDKAKRFGSAREFLDALASIAPAHHPTHSVVIRHRSRRSPISGVLPGTVLLGVLIAVAIWWWGMGGKWTVLGPTWFEIGSVERLTYDGNVQLATLSPDGQTIAYSTSTENGDVLHISNVKTHAGTVLAPTADAYDGLTFSPDGKTLFYVLRSRALEHGGLYSIPVASAAKEPAAFLLDDIDGPITFSPDGTSFIFLRRSDGAERTYSIMLAANSNVHDVKPIVSLPATEILKNLGWLASTNTIVAVQYANHLGQPSLPLVAFYSLTGTVRGEYSDASMRRLQYPTPIDGGRLLLFAGVPQSALQSNLTQLFLPKRQFREQSSDVLAFDDFSASRDGTTVAAVRFDNRTSVWVADALHPEQASRWTPNTESYDSLAWTTDGRIAVPTSRNGGVTLAALDQNGSLQSLGSAAQCIQTRPAMSPKSETMVYSSNCALGGDNFNLWRMDLQTGERRALTSGPSIDRDPDVTPDGKWVVYTSVPDKKRRVFKLPIDGGTPLPVSDLDAAGTPFASPEGKRVLCRVRLADKRWHLAVLSLETGELLRGVSGIPARTFARWSPHGEAIDFVKSNNRSSAIWRLPLNGGEPKLLLSVPDDQITYFAWNSDGNRIAYLRARTDSDVVLLHRSEY